jgi:hypothetical protein
MFVISYPSKTETNIEDKCIFYLKNFRVFYMKTMLNISNKNGFMSGIMLSMQLTNIHSDKMIDIFDNEKYHKLE